MPNKLTKEEDLLLQGFGKTHSLKKQVLFYVNALYISLVPIWLFWKVHMMDPYQYGILFFLGSILSAYLVGLSYKNLKHPLKHWTAQRRENAIAREVTTELDSKPETKKLSRDNKDNRILWKKNHVADNEATAFSIFYNNTLYLFILILLAFYVLRSFRPLVNYTLSTSVAAGLVALLSTGFK